MSWNDTLKQAGFLVFLSLFLGLASHAVRGTQPLFERPVKVEYAALTPIGAEVLRSRLSGGDGPLLVDAREEVEFLQAHLPGAVCYPLHSNPTEAVSAALHGADEIVVYCGSSECNAASELALRLVAQNHPDVKVYVGGLREWKGLGYPVESE